MTTMKDSGIEWIGEIPTEWKIERVGSLFMCRNEKVSDRDFAPLSVSKQGVVPQIETVAKSDNSDNRKLVLKDDFVINSRSDRKQSCGLSFLDGSVSLINIVLSIRDKQQLTTSFLHYVMKNYGFAEEFYKWGHGIVADLWTTRWQELKSIFIPLPPLPEQQRIADYLDKQCSIMDKLAENLQQQIEKLKEYKQSVITEAVTKGLDPNVVMKDSGVEWIGEIPKNWSINKIKYVCTINPKISHPCYDIVSYVPMDCVKNGYMESKEISVSHISSGLTIFSNNDIIMAKVTPCFENGNIAIATDLTNGLAYGSSELFVFRVITANLKYIFYLLQNDKFKDYAKSTMVGTSGLKRVSPNFINSLAIPLPPLPEQQRIADYLDKKCEEIDKLIKIKQEKIDKLSEYKKSLIYECVTGKREVAHE